MKEHKDLPSLTTLGEDIDRLKGRVGQAGSDKAPKNSAMQSGIELVSGALVGGVAGYYLDVWLKTSPVFFIVCFFLGCAGGFLTLYRSAQREDHDYPTTQDTTPTEETDSK